MNNDIHSPHDKSFKDTFSRKRAAIGDLQAYLSGNLKAFIDLNSLTIYPGEYIDEELKSFLLRFSLSSESVR